MPLLALTLLALTLLAPPQLTRPWRWPGISPQYVPSALVCLPEGSITHAQGFGMRGGACLPRVHAGGQRHDTTFGLGCMLMRHWDNAHVFMPRDLYFVGLMIIFRWIDICLGKMT